MEHNETAQQRALARASEAANARARETKRRNAAIRAAVRHGASLRTVASAARLSPETVRVIASRKAAR